MGSDKLRILDREVSRRDIVKIGGIAGLGLAFSKPLMSSVRPKLAFGGDGYGTNNICDPPEFDVPTIGLDSFASPNFTVKVQDMGSGLASITFANVVDVNTPVVSFPMCTTDPVLLTFEITGSAPNVQVNATDCCGNAAPGATFAPPGI